MPARARCANPPNLVSEFARTTPPRMKPGSRLLQVQRVKEVKNSSFYAPPVQGAWSRRPGSKATRILTCRENSQLSG